VSVPAFGCGLDAMTSEKSTTPLREKIFDVREKIAGPRKSFPTSKKKYFPEIFSFPKRGIIIAPHGRRLYTRHHDSIA
jgi:hypothetical protein